MKTLAKFMAVSAVAAGLFGALPTATIAQEVPVTPVCADCEATWYEECVEYSNDPGYYHCTRYEGSNGNWTAVAFWRKLRD